MLTKFFFKTNSMLMKSRHTFKNFTSSNVNSNSKITDNAKIKENSENTNNEKNGIYSELNKKYQTAIKKSAFITSEEFLSIYNQMEKKISNGQFKTDDSEVGVNLKKDLLNQIPIYSCPYRIINETAKLKNEAKGCVFSISLSYLYYYGYLYFIPYLSPLLISCSIISVFRYMRFRLLKEKTIIRLTIKNDSELTAYFEGSEKTIKIENLFIYPSSLGQNFMGVKKDESLEKANEKLTELEKKLRENTKNKNFQIIIHEKDPNNISSKDQTRYIPIRLNTYGNLQNEILNNLSYTNFEVLLGILNKKTKKIIFN